jgi:hypothetical protein
MLYLDDQDERGRLIEPKMLRIMLKLWTLLESSACEGNTYYSLHYSDIDLFP